MCEFIDLIEDALKNDKTALDRLIRQPLGNLPSLKESTSIQLLELLLHNPQLPVYGFVWWLRQILSNEGTSASAVLKKHENKKLIEPLIDRSTSISHQSLRLRGKLDLLLGQTGDGS